MPPITEPPDLNDLRAFAAALGANSLCVQGPGGNVSLKHNGAMWVKASGVWLKEAKTKNIFAIIDQAEGAKQSQGDGEPDYKRLDDNATLRPSIETALHVVLPHRIVVHIHAVPVLALAVRLEAKLLCAEKLAGIPHTFLPYVKPGWPLAQAVREAYASSKSDIFVLGNHGLIVAGDSVGEVEEKLVKVITRADTPVRPSPPPDMEFLEEFMGHYWNLPRVPAVHGLATDPTNLGYATGGSLYPDHVVFLGRACHAVEGEYILGVEAAKLRLVLVNGKGVLLSGRLSQAGEAMVECLAAVLARIPADARLNYLTSRDESVLLNWEAEKLRQSGL
jgi:rhamnose utilization protein RhaD (predicted bifunctional aldolase and dehydrogenase)